MGSDRFFDMSLSIGKNKSKGKGLMNVEHEGVKVDPGFVCSGG